MDKKSIFLSWLFPTISIVTCVIYIIVLFPFLKEYGFKYAWCTLVFAGILGGLIPIIFIFKNKMDISFYIGRKILFSTLYIVASIISWSFLFSRILSFLIIMVPCVAVLLEIRYSFAHCKNIKEKTVVFLSSPIIPYLGMLLDISHAFITTFRY